MFRTSLKHGNKHGNNSKFSTLIFSNQKIKNNIIIKSNNSQISKNLQRNI